MNNYPYIGKNKEGVEALIYSNSSAFLLSGMYSGEMHSVIGTNWFPRKYKNITAEYLANTYGKVESKEHAEFIKLIADNEGIKCNYMVVSDDIKYFYFSGGVLFFTFSSVDDDRFKQITIPLPPKCSEDNTKSMGIAAAAMRTLIDLKYTYHGGEMWKPPLGNAIEKTKEWPQVGDEVLTKEGCKATVIAIHGQLVWVENFDGYLGMDTVCIGSLKKPPTPEEDLRAKLISVMDNSNTAFAYADFISKAIISGEIEGLTYEQE